MRFYRKFLKIFRVDWKSAARDNLEISSFDTDLVYAIFENLDKIEKAENNTLILVYLPTMDDLKDDNQLLLEVLQGDKQALQGLKMFRKKLSEGTAKRGILFIDLVDRFDRLSDEQLSQLFIINSDFPFSAGHYSDRGNKYIAGLIYAKLLSISQTSKIFGNNK